MQCYNAVFAEAKINLIESFKRVSFNTQFFSSHRAGHRHLLADFGSGRDARPDNVC